jgi:hypothetical protein
MPKFFHSAWDFAILSQNRTKKSAQSGAFCQSAAKNFLFEAFEKSFKASASKAYTKSVEQFYVKIKLRE